LLLIDHEMIGHAGKMLPRRIDRDSRRRADRVVCQSPKLERFATPTFTLGVEFHSNYLNFQFFVDFCNDLVASRRLRARVIPGALAN
jgi:hypothetical protein